MISLADRLPEGGQVPVLGRNYFLLRPTSAKIFPCPSPFLHLEINVGLLFFYFLFFTTDTRGAIQDVFWRMLPPTPSPPLLQQHSSAPIHPPTSHGIRGVFTETLAQFGYPSEQPHLGKGLTPAHSLGKGL